MIAIALVVLFIIQLVSFYIIILLNSKIARFKELEVRQDRLIREMDDAIGVYLIEMRAENDRLVKELTEVSSRQNKPDSSSDSIQQQMLDKVTFTSPKIGEQPQAEDISISQEARSFLPKSMVANAYNRQKQQVTSVVKKPQAKPLAVNSEKKELPTFEQQVVQDYKEGMSIEDIAKKTQKGKTEIELLIKFHA